MANDAEVEQIGFDARRLVAEHCLYGVDLNPLAVEMAKLSLWLVTMDRERPFGFLDDRLVRGDALLGLVAVDQLETLNIDPVAGRKLTEGAFDYAAVWRDTLAKAAVLRRRITSQPVNTIRDVEHKTRLLAEAQRLTGTLTAVADSITGIGLKSARASARDISASFLALQFAIGQDPAALADRAESDIQDGRPPGVVRRRPLHWVLTFPEVFLDARHVGFDAIFGNPPFMGGTYISGTLGADYLGWLQKWDGRNLPGNADLVARFLLRTIRLLRSDGGQVGLIATNGLVQGATRSVGLGQAVDRGMSIRRGRSSHPWPSSSPNTVQLSLQRCSLVVCLVLGG